jgi:CheY-like chemotaxis protein
MRHGAWQLDLLLLEDDPNDVQLFKLAFSRCGRRARSLHVVRDGQEAVEYLCGNPGFIPEAHRPPNIIVCDLKMDGMNGFEFLRWRQRHPDYAVIPTIMLSGSYLENEVRTAYQLGANAFFTKPHAVAQLAAILNATMEFWSLAEKPQLERVCS